MVPRRCITLLFAYYLLYISNFKLFGDKNYILEYSLGSNSLTLSYKQAGINHSLATYQREKKRSSKDRKLFARTVLPYGTARCRHTCEDGLNISVCFRNKSKLQGCSLFIDN
jgi:hypothetical protein